MSHDVTVLNIFRQNKMTVSKTSVLLGFASTVGKYLLCRQKAQFFHQFPLNSFLCPPSSWTTNIIPCQGTFLITASSVSAYSKKKKKIVNENTYTSILRSEKYLPAQLSHLYIALIGKGNLEHCLCWKKKKKSKRQGTNCLKCVRECRELLMLL